MLDAAAKELDRRADGHFLAAAPERQQAALAALDAESYAAADPNAPWRRPNSLILTGYYTSGGASPPTRAHRPSIASSRASARSPVRRRGRSGRP